MMKEMMNNNGMEMNVAIEILVVHPGAFHADDIMTAAIVRELFPTVTIKRSSDKTLLAEHSGSRIFEDATIVADIGYGVYDHHQEDAALREDGRKRAACGLVFEDVKGILFPTPESANGFEQSYIIPIEDGDNGVCSNPLSLAIARFVPNWDSDESMESAFMKAVDFAQAILKREIAKAESDERARQIVEPAYDNAEDKRIVVLPQFAPWDAILCAKDEPLFVIHPSLRGGFNLQCVPVKPRSFQSKQPLPESWKTELPDGCTFVHPNRFLAAFTTEEQAVAAAKSLL